MRSACQTLVLAVLVAGAGCRPAPPEGGLEGAAESRPAGGTRALAETLRRADSAAAAMEDVLRPVALQRTSEENALRRYPNAAHVARAKSLGAHPSSAGDVEVMLDDGRLVALEDSSRYWIVRRREEPRYVVPSTHALLEELGRRFHARLGEMGLPPFRMEVTSALRTPAEQAALRRTNENATGGESAHQFGTTVDLSYAAFAPPAELPPALRVAEAPDGMRPALDRVVQLALESVAARKSRELTKILGDVLRAAQDDGIVLVTLERLQPVYHITVARRIAP